MACQNRLIQVLAGDDSTKESTSKRIARAVGIHDLVIREHVDGEDLGLLRLVGSDHHGVLCTLGEHNGAVAGGVALGEKGNGSRDAGEVFGVGVAVRAGPCFGFGFVADDDVDVWQDLLQLGVEELDDEGCGKVEHEGLGNFFFFFWLVLERGLKIGTDLSSGGCFAAQLESRLNAVCQEVALDVEVLGVLDKRGNFGR